MGCGSSKSTAVGPKESPASKTDDKKPTDPKVKFEEEERRASTLASSLPDNGPDVVEEALKLEVEEPERLNAVLRFMFPAGHTTGDLATYWLAPKDDIAAEVMKEFSNDMQYALDGKYDSWKEHGIGCVGLIVLLDQFPRLLYAYSREPKDTVKCLRGDEKAAEIVDYVLENKFHSNLPAAQQLLFCACMSHREDLPVQKKAVELFDEISKTLHKNCTLRGLREVFVHHSLTIQAFERFPSRNAALEREDMPSEPDYRLDCGFFTRLPLYHLAHGTVMLIPRENVSNMQRLGILVGAEQLVWDNADAALLSPTRMWERLSSHELVVRSVSSRGKKDDSQRRKLGRSRSKRSEAGGLGST